MAGLAGPDGGVDRQDEQQDEERVRDVPPVEKDHDRAAHHDHRGDQAGTRASHSARRAVQHQHGHTPSTTCGSTSAQMWKPKMRSESACTGARPATCRRTPSPTGRPRRRGSCAGSSTCCAPPRPRTARRRPGRCSRRRRARRARRPQQRGAGPRRLIGRGSARTARAARSACAASQRRRRGAPSAMPGRGALFRLCDIGTNGQRGLPAGHCRRARHGRPGLRPVRR